MKSAARPSTRSRTKKKAAPAASPVSTVASTDPTPAEAPGDDAPNVAPLEGLLSMGLGVLLLISALFPRSIRQLLMLGLGGGLLYRGITGNCSVYRSLGIDTRREPLLPQLNENLAPAKAEA